MKKFTMLFVCLAFLGIYVANAQQKTITGTITSSDDGSQIPGVSVSVKGTTIGTITNVEGAYSIDVPADGQGLVYSFVGMKTKEVVLGTTTVIDVVMEPDVVGVDEVVVTALGISREKKSLGYSVQEVGGDDVGNVKSDNFVTSLSGRVSGVSVKNTTNMGGSTNVVIRGSSSLTQSNQALFVVDGIPISNAVNNNSGQTTGRSGYDYGNAASDINPNDIESVSVLKGAAASALYGSRAANGVILITTKKGKKNDAQTLGVNINSNVTIGVMDKSTFPEYQSEYGAGYGTYYYSHPDDAGIDGYDVNGDGVIDMVAPMYEDAARGGAFNPEYEVYQWDSWIPESENYGKAYEYKAAGDNGAASFFETAVSTTNSVDVSGASDKSTYRLSYTNLNQKGILPNSELKRNNYVFTGSHKILDNLKVSSSANFISTAATGRPSTGYSGNIMSSFRQWYSVDADMSQLKDMYEQTGKNYTWNPKGWDPNGNGGEGEFNFQPNYWDNPYWVRYENYQQDKRNRLIGYAQLDWGITDYLSFMGRAAIDTYSELQEERKAVGSVSGEFGVGRTDATSGYSRFQRTFTESNVDFMLSFNKNITDDFGLSAVIGSNIRRSEMDRTFTSTNGGLAVPGLYSLSNSVDPMLPPEESLQQIGVNGFFGSVSLDFRRTVFIDATVRRDQSSTLPTANNAYVYPSITGAFVFSELVDADWMSFGKLRLNYAEVGNDAPALRVNDTYFGNAPMYGTSLVTVGSTKFNENLLPERQKSLEGGLEMNFMKNRIGFDLAMYKMNTINQLMAVSISQTTGYSSKWVNAGEIENKGVELSAFVTPVKTSDFAWRFDVNYSKNQNMVVSLYTDEAGNEVTNLQIASLQGGMSVNARVGEPYGALTGSAYVRDDAGNLLVHDNGRYASSDGNNEVIGNVTPDFQMGFNNTLTYKDFSLSFLLDWSKGGDVFSLDHWYGAATGLYAESAGLNDLGNPKRDFIEYVNDDPTQGYASTSGGTINPGVYEEGSVDANGNDVSGQPNATRVNNANYGADGYAVSPNERFVYDASYFKLREVVFTYNLPKDLMAKSKVFAGASLSFVGSNLWIISKNLPYADPEASQGAGNIQGWQSGVLPTTRNFGFNIKLQF